MTGQLVVRTVPIKLVRSEPGDHDPGQDVYIGEDHIRAGTYLGRVCKFGIRGRWMALDSIGCRIGPGDGFDYAIHAIEALVIED